MIVDATGATLAPLASQGCTLGSVMALGFPLQQEE